MSQEPLNHTDEAMRLQALLDKGFGMIEDEVNAKQMPQQAFEGAAAILQVNAIRANTEALLAQNEALHRIADAFEYKNRVEWGD